MRWKKLTTKNLFKGVEEFKHANMISLRATIDKKSQRIKTLEAENARLLTLLGPLVGPPQENPPPHGHYISRFTNQKAGKCFHGTGKHEDWHWGELAGWHAEYIPLGDPARFWEKQ